MSSENDFQMSKRILEINPNSKLIKRMVDISGNEQHHDFIKDTGKQLFANAMLIAGLVPNLEEMVDRVDDLLLNAAQNKSSIAT